jgi:flagellar hook-associated protein 1 FlgK
MESALSIAIGGLANVNRQLSVVSQNVANASTASYTREVATQTSVTASGIGMGVRSGPVQRDLNTQLQASLLSQNSVVSALQTRQTALQTIDAVQGTVGSGDDLSSLLGQLQDAFSTLETDPSSQVQQSAVVSPAQTLTQQINALSQAYATARQTAEDSLQSGVDQLNTTLTSIGKLSDQIVQLQATGQSTADLENQRDAALSSLSQLIDVRYTEQSNGDLLISTTSGLSLPIHGSNVPFSIASANLGATSYYPGGGAPAITLNGADVTTQISGGSLGANLELRDDTLPTCQAELDEFAETLSTRFDAQGLTLFTDPTGTVPSSTGSSVQTGYVGYASTIQVNPAVIATPSLVRDGTHTVTGSATGASAFTPNPSGGSSGFTDMITRVLDYALGDQVQAGVAQPSSAVTGLGPAGTLSAPYTGSGDLASLATALVGTQAQYSSTTSTQLTTEQSVQTTLSGKLSAQSGVSIDTEMSTMIQLQNAYGANARVIAAIQSMWTQLLQSVS